MNRRGLVLAGQPLLDARAVVGDVQLVAGAERLRGGDTRVIVLTHLTRR